MIPLLFFLAAIGDDLAAAVRPVVAAENYHFSVDASNAKVEGDYQKGLPLFVRADGIDFYRQGDRLVYKQDEIWQRTRTGTLSDPLRILVPSAKVQSVRLPHEEIGQLAKALTNLKKVENKKAEEQGQALISGRFGPADAKQLARTEDRELARGGMAWLWLDKGQVVKYQIEITVKGVRGNADVDGTVTNTVTISNLGAVKLNVPAAAKKALE